MSTSPPVPPPPPPPPLIPAESPRLSFPDATPKDITKSFSYSPDLCKWASNHYQLQESCAKNNLCLYEPPYKFKYRHLEPILQIGPTCGLVALSMLVNGEVPPAEILSIVKMQGYSCNGEMFSCKDMVRLSEKVFDLVEMPGAIINLKTGLWSEETVERLLAGALLLVPYDADANHSPCLKQGHTAHWAIICGVIIIKALSEGPTSDPNNVYVLARHGKSKYLAIWNLDDLAKSNKNLWEFSPKKGGDGLKYVLPEGGVGGKNGLRNQYLLFEGL